jgi:hypothetical protein
MQTMDLAAFDRSTAAALLGAVLDGFPSLAQAIDEHHNRAQVVLGANDKHLLFRSCVGVRLLGPGRVECADIDTGGLAMRATPIFMTWFACLAARARGQRANYAAGRMTYRPSKLAGRLARNADMPSFCAGVPKPAWK